MHGDDLLNGWLFQRPLLPVYDDFSGDVRYVETDPFGKELKEPGSKADSGKSPVFRGLLDYFPRACVEVARVSLVGSKKYSWKGWESVPDGYQRYSDALARHLVAESIEGPVDDQTELLHAAQVAWNAMARLELLLRTKNTIPPHTKDGPSE